MTDWRTLSILRTSKLIHLEASNVLYAHSHFHISTDWSITRVDEKKLRNVSFHIDYDYVSFHINYDYGVSLLEFELPRLDVDVFDLPDRDITLHSFARFCDTEKALKKVTVRVAFTIATVLDNQNRELEKLEILGHRLARFWGVEEIIVELIYDLCSMLWVPGAEPKSQQQRY